MSKRRQHFAAHKGTIRCAAWGKKYGGLFATGGEDHVVNVWRLGHVHALKTLDSLFTSPVSALVFNTNETKLAAATDGGTIRIYDFENDKVIRTLNGHLTECTSLHFHPFASNYLISTSRDNNLKVWDLRERKCMNTFRGHTDAVLCSQFSPDGRLVATGGADACVKVWDLTKGQKLASFGGDRSKVDKRYAHRGPVTDLAFHPFEFVLASTCDADRSAKLWDLESYTLLDTAPGITGQRALKRPRVMLGDEMLCFGSAGVRVYPLDSRTCSLSHKAKPLQVACDWDTGV